MFQSLPDLVDEVADGAHLALPADAAGIAMAACRALIRRGARDLRLLCVPTGGLAADVLIGAGGVAEIEAAAVGLGDHGPAPCFTRAVETGAVTVKPTTATALEAQLTAAAHGAPYLPLPRRVVGAVAAARPDWRLGSEPGTEDGAAVVKLPALAPDVALVHAAVADECGNLWIGRRRELATLARAAARTLATVEEIVPGSLLTHERDAAGALAADDVDGIALAPMGARPLALAGHYGADRDALAAYAATAATAAGFRRWLAHALGRTAPG